MRDLRRNKVIPDDQVWLYDGFIYIISRNASREGVHYKTQYSIDVICLNPEYDDPLSLVDIKNRFPNVIKVIHEDWLKGNVYNYGNHATKDNGEEFWELTGETMGFA